MVELGGIGRLKFLGYVHKQGTPTGKFGGHVDCLRRVYGMRLHDMVKVSKLQKSSLTEIGELAVAVLQTGIYLGLVW